MKGVWWYCADLERTPYLPGRAGIVDWYLKGGRRVARGAHLLGNADETVTVSHLSVPITTPSRLSRFPPT